MLLPRIMLPLCALAWISAPAVVSAAPFASSSLALTSTKYDDVKLGTGFSLAGGYEVDEFGRFPLFFEGSYYDSGKLKVEDSDLRLHYDGFQLFGGIGAKLSKKGNSRAWAKIGYYSLDGKLADSTGSISEKGTGLSFGLGVDWMFAHQLGMRFEVEQPTKVKAFPGLDGSPTTSLSIVKVGLVWRPQFGSDIPTTPAVMPSYTPPSPAAQSTTPRSQLAIGMTATLRGGTAIRVQPRYNAPVEKTLVTSVNVTLNGSSLNSGEWWLVKGNDVLGWVEATEIFTP